MNSYFYVFYDKNLKEYTQPIISHKPPEYFMEELVLNLKCCLDAKILKQYQDYTLFSLAEYDDGIGEFSSLEKKSLIDLVTLCTGLIGNLESEVSKDA